MCLHACIPCDCAARHAFASSADSQVKSASRTYSEGAKQALHSLAMHCLQLSNLRCCLTPALIQVHALERRRRARLARRAPPRMTRCAARKNTCRRPRPWLRKRTRPPRARRTRHTWLDPAPRRPRLRKLRPPPRLRARRCFMNLVFFFDQVFPVAEYSSNSRCCMAAMQQCPTKLVLPASSAATNTAALTRCMQQTYSVVCYQEKLLE